MAVLFFVAWVLFFDRNDLLSRYANMRQLKRLRQDKMYYKQKIEENRKDMIELKTNPKNLEKFAREKYLMKKDNEDVFVFVPEGKKLK